MEYFAKCSMKVEVINLLNAYSYENNVILEITNEIVNQCEI